MVFIDKSVSYEYVVKVEFMSARKYEVHRFCLFSDAVKCLKEFHDNREAVQVELYTELKFKRDYNPLFDD